MKCLWKTVAVCGMVWGILLLAGCRTKDSRTEEQTIDQVENTELESSREITIYSIGPETEVMTDYSQNQMIQWLEQQYDVHISFRHSELLADSEKQDVEEMIQNGAYCDILFLRDENSYKGGVKTAVEDGIFWNLTDYVQKYMPNYYEWIQSDEELRRMAYDDDGKIVGLRVLSYNAVEQKVEEQMSAGGMIVRGDWLDEAGLELPVTYQDWEEMLTVFKERYGCSQPLYFPGKGYSEMSPGFSSGFGAIPKMQMNGKQVEYGPMTEGWKAYVTTMHEWYEKGLIGSEYVTNNSYGIDRSACEKEETGAMLCVWTWVDSMEKAISKDADFRAVPYPVLQEGQVAQAGDPESILNEKSVYITTKVSKEDLPWLLGLLDQLYDKQTALELAYGIEGDTYTLDAQGQPQLTDKILQNPDGYAINEATDLYLMPVNLMLLKDWSREFSGISAENMEMITTWDGDGTDLYVPNIQLTTAEEEIYNQIMNEVNTVVEEMTNRMIVGAVDIETGWDTYIQTLQDLGIQEAVDAYQAAYNRYIHR